MRLIDKQSGLVDAKIAAEFLGVKRQTLYAYVSRGLVRTVRSSPSRAKLYMLHDLEQLQFKGNRGKGRPLAVTRNGAMPTSITSIDDNGPCYRGRLAIDLAKMCRPFEDCVELLWTGVLPAKTIAWATPRLPEGFFAFVSGISNQESSPSTRQVLSVVAAAYAARMGRNPETYLGGSLLAARQLLQILAASIGLLYNRQPLQTFDPDCSSIARTIATGTSIEASQQHMDAINACLILSADHELAPSTYAARVAASGGADVFACVVSGFGTFEGPLNGLGCDEPEELLRSASSAKHYVTLLKAQIKRKEPLIGFNHPSYPTGDPRARYLIDLSRTIAKPGSGFWTIAKCIEAAESEFGFKPSLALSLIAMASALSMPREMAGALMAIGRASGWIAHVFEQRTAGEIAPPRTRYIGPQSESLQP